MTSVSPSGTCNIPKTNPELMIAGSRSQPTQFLLDSFRWVPFSEVEMLHFRNPSYSILTRMYQNQEVFLIDGHIPDDRDKLNAFEKRGICFAAHNQGIRSIHPHLWFCDELPDANDLKYWLDPSIVKLVPTSHLKLAIPVKNSDQVKPYLVQDCPAVLCYEALLDNSQELRVCNLRGSVPMLPPTILALLKELGFKAVVRLSIDAALKSTGPISACRYNLAPPSVEELPSWVEAIESRTQEFNRLDTQGMYDRAQRERDLEKSKAHVALENIHAPLPASSAADFHLEIVSHCWRYATLLNFQLSSFVLAPPKVRVTMTVYYAEEDEKTAGVLQFFSRHFPPNVTGNWQALPKEKLFRRAIGRNHAALNTKADWIWFTDCDYVFRENYLDRLCAELINRSPPLAYPRCAMRVPNDLTDSLIKDVQEAPPGILEIPKEYGIPQYFNRAIGGLQIVHGNIARELGYLKNHWRMQQPAPHWMRTIDDVRFRKSLGIAGVAIELPGLVRLGHAVKGRSNAEVAN